MRVELTESQCIVSREPDDPRFHGTRNAAGESRLLHHVKCILNARGFDLIKKRMWKDGHMMNDMQQYVRSRNLKAPDAFCFYNGRWAIEGANDTLNRTGSVHLVRALFNEPYRQVSLVHPRD